jgi:hypothetical protein
MEGKPKSVPLSDLFREDYEAVCAELDAAKELASRGVLRGVFIIGMTHDGQRVWEGGSYDRTTFVFAMEHAKLRLLLDGMAEAEHRPPPGSGDSKP